MFNFYNIRASCKKNVYFEFEKKLTNGDNVQGSCGILTVPRITEIDNQSFDCRELIINSEYNKVFYKFGNNGYNCTLARQEYIISRNLLLKCSHIPNFLRPIIYMKNHLVRKDVNINPFSIDSCKKQNIMCVDIVIFEYLSYKMSFHDFIKKYIDNIKIINSIVLQILLSIIIAQQNCEFVHNDLHAKNIVILQCDKNLKLEYTLKIIDELKVFTINTHGFIPVIIDYGFAYSSDCQHSSLECADSDNHGLITYSFDCISDFIRLFVVLTKCNYNPEFTKFITELFRKLPISMNNSWEKITSHDTTYQIEKIIYKTLEDMDHKIYLQPNQIVRLIMRNIILPVCYNNNVDGNIYDELKKFFVFWIDIELWLKYDYERWYVFRELLDSIRKNPNENNNIIKNVHDAIFSVTGKNLPIQAEWLQLIHSAEICIKLIQNIVYKSIHELHLKRTKMLYSKLISGEHMFKESVKFFYKKSKLEKNDILLRINNINFSNQITKVE